MSEELHHALLISYGAQKQRGVRSFRLLPRVRWHRSVLEFPRDTQPCRRLLLSEKLDSYLRLLAFSCGCAFVSFVGLCLPLSVEKSGLHPEMALQLFREFG